MEGDSRETVDVSEVADFSAVQQQQTNVETSRIQVGRLLSLP